MKILFYDLETTGLSSEYNEIINIAAIVYNDETKSIENEFCVYIKPTNGIPWKISQLTGITNEMVAKANNESLTLYDFMEWVKKQDCQKTAGHNINKFDRNFLITRCSKYKIKDTLPTESIDTLELAKEALNAGCLPDYNFTTAKGNISLKQEYLMQYFDLGEQEHKALTDVQYCIMIYNRLTELLENQDFGF